MILSISGRCERTMQYGGTKKVKVKPNTTKLN